MTTELNNKTTVRPGSDERLSRLAMLKVPSIRINPGLPRSMREVDAALQETFRDLAAGRKPWPLYLWGAVGTGKSRAALALCDFCRSANFWTFEDCVGKVLSGDPVEKSRYHDAIRRRDLIVIDEIGTREKVTDAPYSSLHELLETRERHAGHRAVYISNLNIGDIERLFDKRVSSRLAAGTVFELTGIDRRQAQ